MAFASFAVFPRYGLTNRQVKTIRKLLPKKPVGLLGCNKKDMLILNDITTLTSFDCLLGSEEEEIQNHNDILTMNILNGYLVSDKQ